MTPVLESLCSTAPTARRGHLAGPIDNDMVLVLVVLLGTIHIFLFSASTFWPRLLEKDGAQHHYIFAMAVIICHCFKAVDLF